MDSKIVDALLNEIKHHAERASYYMANGDLKRLLIELNEIKLVVDITCREIGPVGA